MLRSWRYLVQSEDRLDSCQHRAPAGTPVFPAPYKSFLLDAPTQRQRAGPSEVVHSPTATDWILKPRSNGVSVRNGAGTRWPPGNVVLNMNPARSNSIQRQWPRPVVRNRARLGVPLPESEISRCCGVSRPISFYSSDFPEVLENPKEVTRA